MFGTTGQTYYYSTTIKPEAALRDRDQQGEIPFPEHQIIAFNPQYRERDISPLLIQITNKLHQCNKHYKEIIIRESEQGRHRKIISKQVIEWLSEQNQ